MALNDVEIKPDMVVISVPKTKTKIPRLFMITEESWIMLIRKYVDLRPPHMSHDRFFLTYRGGRCIKSPIGINKIGEVPKIIAKFLNLANPEKYTGHCFRRSSASHLANKGEDLLTIKKFAGWKSSAVAEGYVDASFKKKVEVANVFSNSRQTEASTSAIPDHEDSIRPNSMIHERVDTEIIHDGATTHNQNILLSDQSLPKIQISASETATVTVNVYSHCHIQK